MTANTATREIVAPRREDGHPSNSNHASGANPKSFARQLRALGQALERFSFSVFDLQITSGTYLVIAKARPPERASFSFSRLFRQFLRWSSFTRGFTNQDREIELRFSPEDIEQFDLHGQSRRNDASKVPDPYSISQLLRGAGCYLDNRNITDQVRISFMGRCVTIGHETGEGRAEHVQHDLEYVYDHWVNMYLRRSNRVKPSAPAKPTVLVAARGVRA